MGLLFFYSAFSLISIKISLHLHQPISTLSLTSLFNHFFALSPSTPRHCLPLRQNPGRSIKPSRSLFFSFFFLFFVMIWNPIRQWVGGSASDGQIDGGRIGDGWIAGGRIAGGVDLCSDLFLFLVLFFCFGSCDLMVDSAAVMGWFWWLWFFFFWWLWPQQFFWLLLLMTTMGEEFNILF